MSKFSVMIQDRLLETPIIQGGMGIGVSLGNLAGHVMLEGGMGVISAAQPGYLNPNFIKDPFTTNCEALEKEINKAKSISKGKGLLAVNIMVAGKRYQEYAKKIVEYGVDAIISGAGLPLDLPSLVPSSVLIAPIVSSARAAQLIFRVWQQRYQRTPDFVVIEGSEAGGHLGFKLEDLVNNTTQTLAEILQEVKVVVQENAEKLNKKIPIFVAGGIFTGQDIAKYLKLGADGVQMATRFIATEQCDASLAFKQMFIHAKKEDIVLVKSPAGFPGRAIKTEFMEEVAQHRIAPKQCFDCLHPCDVATTPYCISKALMEAAAHDPQQGLVFTGSNGYRIDKIVSVHDLVTELVSDMEQAMKGIK